MTTALILIASGILIGAGIGVIWRDVRRSRRRAFILQREAQATTEPEVEITIARGEFAAPLPQATAEKALKHSAANGHAKESGAKVTEDAAALAGPGDEPAGDRRGHPARHGGDHHVHAVDEGRDHGGPIRTGIGH